MRYPIEESDRKHQRIVKEASRRCRELGFENESVGELIKAAGPTHGACHAHSGSKEELQAAAVACGQNFARSPSAQQAECQRNINERYLSRWYRGQRLHLAGLEPEVARSAPELKAAFERGLEDILFAKAGDWTEAIFQAAAKIGAIVLARSWTLGRNP